jgi:hypothetical protein
MHNRDLISISAAAERLAALGDRIDRTALSRYVKGHGIETVRSGRETLVSFADVVNHRRTNDLLGPASHALPALSALQVLASNRDESAMSGARSAPTSRTGKSRKDDADADLRELELARRTGLLLVKRDVEDAAGDAIGAFEAAMFATLNKTAEAMAEEYRVESRRVRQRLRMMMDDGMAAFRKRLEEMSEVQV